MGDETDDGDDKVMRLASAHNTLDKERLSKIRARLKSSILTTTCAVCARPLDDTFHRCDRCETRYCSADCERGDSDHSEYCEDTHDIAELKKQLEETRAQRDAAREDAQKKIATIAERDERIASLEKQLATTRALLYVSGPRN